MRKTSFALATAICAASLLAGCATDLSAINHAAFEPATLDVADGRGALPYGGGILPENAAGSPRIYRFVLAFGPGEGGYPDKPVLVIGPSSYPYRLSLNGRVLHSFGSEGDGDRTRMFSCIAIDLPEGSFLERNLIEVEAFVTVERTPLMEIGVARAMEASSYVFWRNFFMTQFVAGGFAIGLVLLIYFLFIFLLNKNKDRRFLFFALLCGLFSLAAANIVFNHLAASDTLLTKISRLGFLYCVTMLSFYVMEATGLLARKRWIKVLELSVVTALSAWIVTRQGFNETNAAFHVAINVAITPNLLFSVVLVVVASIKKGFAPFAILSLGFVGLIATSLFDMVYETGAIMPYAWTLSYGYEWLVICVFLELAVKQERISRLALSQSEALNEKNAILGRVLGQLRGDSDALASSSEELAVSTREISSTGSQQAVAVREIVATMEEANALLSRISQKSSLVHQDSKATAQKAEEGVDDVKAALAKLEIVIGKIAESISLISDFNEHLGSIKDIVKLIEGIASQIRIIAFNASLEAVAAGEAGRNFGIVAEEVKRLSDSTVTSVKNIKEKVGSLIGMSDNVVQVARAGYASLEQSWDIASGMGDSFAGIASAAESSAGATADIDSSLREEARAFEQIVQTLKEISSGVNNFVDSAKHTSETTNRLNDIAETLHGLIVQYSGNGADAAIPAEPGSAGALGPQKG